MLIHDARCVGYLKTQGGERSGLANRARISWRKTQTLHTTFGETTETQLPSTQCRN